MLFTHVCNFDIISAYVVKVIQHNYDKRIACNSLEMFIPYRHTPISKHYKKAVLTRCFKKGSKHYTYVAKKGSIDLMFRMGYLVCWILKKQETLI
jgi:hypothetical protein